MTPKKYAQNFHTPKKIHFSENQKNIEIQKFDPKKMGRAYVCMKLSEYPLGVQAVQVNLLAPPSWILKALFCFSTYFNLSQCEDVSVYDHDSSQL